MYACVCASECACVARADIGPISVPPRPLPAHHDPPSPLHLHLFSQNVAGWVWCYIPSTPAFPRQRQADWELRAILGYREFKASLRYKRQDSVYKTVNNIVKRFTTSVA